MPAVHGCELGVLIMLAETCISLPVLSRKVPAKLRFFGEQSDALERLFKERIRHRWPLAYPDRERHANPGETVREMLQELSGGYTESTTFITPHLVTFGEPMETECGATMGEHYAVELEDNVLYLRSLILRLEGERQGLGETVLAHLSKDAGAFIPGPFSDHDLFGLYREWRLEGCDDDDNAREHLIGMGYEEEDVTGSLPSVVSSDLGGPLFVNPKKRLTDRQLLLALNKAGVNQAKELAHVLTVEMPTARMAARSKLMPVANYYWPWEVMNIWLTGATKKRDSAIWGFVDQVANDRAQVGDPDYAIAVDRVAAPHEYHRRPRGRPVKHAPVGAGKAIDGLKIISLILRAWSATDRALVILHNYEELT